MDACVWCGRDSGCVGLPACPRGAGKPRTGVTVFEPQRERLWLALSGLGDGLSLRGSRGSVRSPGGLHAGWLSSVHQAAMKKGKLAKGKSRKYGIQCLIVWGES